MNKITDINGRTTIIENEVLYTVIYSIPGINELKVLTNLCHQFDNDNFIGQSDNYGYIAPDEKIYFDGNVSFDDGHPIKQVHRVFTNKEWQSVLKNSVI